MKTTVEISDALLEAAKRAALAERSTLRGIIEAALRAHLAVRIADPPFELRDAAVDGDGRRPEAAALSEADLQRLIYDGRGG